MKTKVKNLLFALLITFIVMAGVYYFMLPEFNIHSAKLVTFIIIGCVIFAVCYLFSLGKYRVDNEIMANGIKGFFKNTMVPIKVAGIIVILVLAFSLIGSITGAKIFNASRYQKLLTVEKGDFTKDIEKVTYNQIPTLDRDSAGMLGDKKMGELSDMVSQFSVMDNYTQINYKDRPVRVTPLDYYDVFKWISNVKNGTPGYLSIDMVTQEVSLVRVDGGIKYSTAEYFNRNLIRHIRFNYPTKMFAEPTFEVDENTTPYWICPTYEYKIGLYGGKDINGAVLVNATDGTSKYYDLKDIPTWVDRVFNAELIVEQYNYYGTFIHGFWNSVFAQKDNKVTTEGYNYIALNDDVYMYTGVTSVSSDRSNIGFLLTNQRTKQTKYYEIPGATEYSAMNSAEGEVQNLRYKATFPLLLNIKNEPTYFIALKDNENLVKMYSMVNVGQYQIVAKGQTLLECEKDYIKKLASSGKSKPETLYKKVSGTITDIRTAVIDSNSYYYFKIGDKTYYMSVANDNSIVMLSVGDNVDITFENDESNLIAINSITKK